MLLENIFTTYNFSCHAKNTSHAHQETKDDSLNLDLNVFLNAPLAVTPPPQRFWKSNYDGQFIKNIVLWEKIGVMGEADYFVFDFL